MRLLLPLLACAACVPEIAPRDRCASDAECFVGERCVSGTCVAGDVLGDGLAGGPDGAAGATDAVGDGAALDVGDDLTLADAVGGDLGDPGHDGGVPDAGALDVGVLEDAGGGDAGPDAGDSTQDAGAQDAGAQDAGSGDVDAGPAPLPIHWSLKLSTVTAANGAFVDLGLCPNPVQAVSGGVLTEVAACDNAVFLRVTGQNDSLLLQGRVTRGGQSLAASGSITAAKSAAVQLDVSAQATPADPTALVAVKLVAKADGGASIDWDTTTESRWLARFGAFNVQEQVPCLLPKAVSGTLSKVSVDVGGKVTELPGLQGGLDSKGAWTQGAGTVDFSVDTCNKQHFLLKVDGP